MVKVVSIWEFEFRKILRENRVLEIKLSSHPYVKYYPINIRDALYGVEPRPKRHTMELSRERNPLCGCYQYVPLHL